MAAPRPRVKRIATSEEGGDSLGESPLMKVRPFLECFSGGRWAPTLILEGRLLQEHFEVRVGTSKVVLVTAVSGSDAHGPYVLLRAQEHPLGYERVLRVEADAVDDEAAHAAISYVEVHSDPRAKGELAYAKRWYSVYFNPLGLVDGSSCGGPQSIGPAKAPS